MLPASASSSLKRHVVFCPLYDLSAYLLFFFSHLAGIFRLQNILTLIKSLLSLQAVIQCLPVSKDESANQILTFFVIFVVALLHQSNEEIFACLSKKCITVCLFRCETQ